MELIMKGSKVDLRDRRETFIVEAPKLHKQICAEGEEFRSMLIQ